MFSTISDELNWPLEIHVWAGTRAKVSIFFQSVCVYEGHSEQGFEPLFVPRQVPRAGTLGAQGDEWQQLPRRAPFPPAEQSVSCEPALPRDLGQGTPWSFLRQPWHSNDLKGYVEL